MSPQQHTLICSPPLLPLPLLLPDAVHNLLEANKIVAATCESQQQHLYFQRNALISGGR
jgi:hypothetical protein